MRILYSWLGLTDYKMFEKARGDYAKWCEDPGPLLRTILGSKLFDHIVLLVDLNKNDDSNRARRAVAEEVKSSLSVALGQNTQVRTLYYELLSPSAYGEIFDAVHDTVLKTIPSDNHYHCSFNVSSGTPAMTSIWIIAAHGVFPADLLESSREEGVKILAFGEFSQIAARYINIRDREIFDATSPDRLEDTSALSVISINQAVRKFDAKVKKISATDAPVLILGESGTGKEVAAKQIHDFSKRHGKKFIAVNCGAIQEGLFESQMFGYVKGAFTGADKDRRGLFEEADGGTIFLDEIGELTLVEQVKLLRVLQEKEFLPVGGNQPLKVNVRVIAATNRDLVRMVAENIFRMDLYYRLAIVTIRTISLRDRKEDIPAFIDWFRRKWQFEREFSGVDTEFSQDAVDELMKYDWPGNIRQFENVVRQIMLLSGYGPINGEDIRDILGESSMDLPQKAESWQEGLRNGESLDIFLARIQKQEIEKTIINNPGMAQKDLAEKLGLIPQTFRNRCRELGISI